MTEVAITNLLLLAEWVREWVYYLQYIHTITAYNYYTLEASYSVAIYIIINHQLFCIDTYHVVISMSYLFL